MNLVHSHSELCGKSELSFFDVPPTQAQILNRKQVEYRPITALADGGNTIEVKLSGSGDEFMDLYHATFRVVCKIVKADGSAIGDDAKVAPTNLLLHSLFSQINILINDKVVTQPANTYGYRAMIETLLNMGSDAKQSHLTSSLYYKDTAGQMDVADPTGECANKGLANRYKFSVKGQQIDMQGPLHLDLFSQEKLMIPGVDILLQFVKQKNEFCLMSSTPDEKYRIVIEQFSIFCDKVQMASSVLNDLNQSLERGDTVKYHLDRVQVKTKTIAKDQKSLVLDNLFMGQLPKTIILALVSNDAYSGNYTKNPYNFHHNNVSYLAIDKDGEQVPVKPFQPVFKANGGGNYIRCYNSSFSINGIHLHGNAGHFIDRLEYPEGYCFYGFNLAPDNDAHGHYSLRKDGNVKVEIHFSANIDSTLNLLVYAEFDSVLELNKTRQPIFDYA